MIKILKIMIVGDDLYTTNPDLVEKGIQNNWSNSLLLKVNQIGTITESVHSAQLMFNQDYNVIVSHRSGETNHSYLVDLAVGIGAQYVKIGAPCRGERIEKFNRLTEIYELLFN
jgi:enolase